MPQSYKSLVRYFSRKTLVRTSKTQLYMKSKQSFEYMASFLNLSTLDNLPCSFLH